MQCVRGRYIQRHGDACIAGRPEGHAAQQCGVGADRQRLHTGSAAVSALSQSTGVEADAGSRHHHSGGQVQFLIMILN